MNVPVFCIRLPWSIVIEKVSKSRLSSKLTPEDKLFGLTMEQITEVTSMSRVTISPDEEKFYNDSKIIFPEVYRIRNGYKGEVLRLIAESASSLAKVHTHMTSIFQTAFHGRESKTRSGMQQSINHHLHHIEIPLSGEQLISYDKAVYICEMAKILMRNNEFTKQVDDILAFIKKWEPAKNPRNQKNRKIDSDAVVHSKFWNVARSNVFPARFFNSHFKTYEHIRATLDAKHEWGIDSRYIHIGNVGRDGYCPITVTTLYDKELIHSHGLVTFDPVTNCLVAQVFRKSTKNWKSAGSPAFFIMKVWDSALQSLFIGHYTTNSLYYNHQVTKLMVWESVSEPVEPREYSNNDASFKEIDLSIRRILKQPGMNRIQMPDARISNLSSRNDEDRSLRKFVDSYASKIQADGKMNAFLGSYYVCYLKKMRKPLAGAVSNDRPIRMVEEIRVDYLNVFFDEDSVQFRVKYLDLLDDDRQSADLFSYLGFAETRYDNVRLMPEEPVNIFEKSEPKNILPFMTFDLPSCSGYQAVEVFANTDFFEGIITGLDHVSKRSFSSSAILVKTSKLPKQFGDLSYRRDLTKENSLWAKIVDYFSTRV